jgi:hypothetical protein
LAGKVIVDITNPLDHNFAGLVTRPPRHGHTKVRGSFTEFEGTVHLDE